MTGATDPVLDGLPPQRSFTHFVLASSTPPDPPQVTAEVIGVTLLLPPEVGAPLYKLLLQCFRASTGHLHFRLSHWRITLRCSTNPPQVKKEPEAGFDSSAAPSHRPRIYCQGQSLVDARKQLPPQSV